VLAVSIDLDELHHYRKVHGLLPATEAARVVYEVAVPRALGFARSLGIPLTFFAVAQDLEHRACADVLVDARRAGHAIESHSSTHPYDLVRLPPSAIEREVGGSFDAIERAVGERPRGFRSPGYTTSDAVFDAIEAAGATFDSSILPSPPYFAAKLAVMGAMAMVGRRSASVASGLEATLAPVRPYRPGRPYTRPGKRPLVELPIQVTRRLRVPVIGTLLGRAGERGARALVRGCGDTPLLNLELHGIDFLNAAELGSDLRGLPELRVPMEERLAAIRAGIGEGTKGRTAVTSREAARELAAELQL
jgi:peptidoglycan/xylan/chitin deacetylase (PgdA/CDA1 family)